MSNIILAISDLHGHLPDLKQCDIVCIGGDITPLSLRHDVEGQWKWFNEIYLPWVETVNCQYLITIAGNHDYFFGTYDSEILSKYSTEDNKFIYLENTGITLKDISFYGTPNINKPPNSLASYLSSEELTATFGKIPNGLDILITHASPYGANGTGKGDNGEDFGSKELTAVLEKRNIAYVFCGHIHTGNHELSSWNNMKIANVSYCDENKEPKYDFLEIEM